MSRRPSFTGSGWTKVPTSGIPPNRNAFGSEPGLSPRSDGGDMPLFGRTAPAMIETGEPCYRLS